MNQTYRRYVPYTTSRNFGCRLTEFTLHNLPCVTLENSLVRVSVCAGKGADIYELLYKPTDTEMLLHTPLGLRNGNGLAPTINLREGSFLDFYEGGWQELLPNAADYPCDYKNAQIGMHGEVAMLPWQYRIDEDSPSSISVSFSVWTTRTPFHLQRKIALVEGSARIAIHERLTNVGGERMEFMWGHHPALGWPFLEQDSVIALPSCTVIVRDGEIPPGSRLVEQESDWPFVKGTQGETIDLSKMPGPEARAHDMAFLTGFKEGWYAVRNANLGLEFRLDWDVSVFPYLWWWQVTRGAYGYPWYGATYNLALEPHSSYPPLLTRAIEHGTQLSLEPGEVLVTELTAQIGVA